MSRLDNFLKFFETNFLTKVAQKYITFRLFLSKKCVGHFLGNLWTNCVTFYSNIWSPCLQYKWGPLYYLVYLSLCLIPNHICLITLTFNTDTTPLSLSLSLSLLKYFVLMCQLLLLLRVNLAFLPQRQPMKK